MVLAALVYLGMRVVSAVVLLLVQRHQPVYFWLDNRPYLGMTMHWDSRWFQEIAMTGYPRHLPVNYGLLQHRLLERDRVLEDRFLLHDRAHLRDPLLVREHLHQAELRLHELRRRNAQVGQNQWAFYPAFPFITRAVMVVTGTGFAVAAGIVNLSAGAVAAGGIARLMEVRIPRVPALGVVAAWAALPMAPTLQLAYSEAVAMALVAVALLWIVGEHWLRASVAALALGLARPIVPPLAVVYAAALALRWRRRGSEPLTSGELGRMGVGLGLTALGAVLWPLLAWRVTGVRDAYLRTEDAWHHGDTAPFTGLQVLDAVPLSGHPGLPLWTRLMVVGAIVLVLALTVLATRSPRLHPLLVVWCGAYLVYDLAVSNMHAAELRMLLPLFPLLAVACGVASTRISPWWRQRVWLLVALGIVGQLGWVWFFVRYIAHGSQPS